jgi:hypothetical protein
VFGSVQRGRKPTTLPKEIEAGSAKVKGSQEVLGSISTPDKVETSIGTLEFFDGAPSPETAGKAYDCVDTMRGVDSFLKGVPLTAMGSVAGCRLLE